MHYFLWIIFLIGMLILEASTTNLVSIWFAVGALGALILKVFGASFVWQIAGFIIVSAVSIIIARPFIKKHHNRKTVPTNADMLIGLSGTVTDEINEEKFAGKVNVSGKEWSAVSEDKSQIDVGEKVKVKSISGVKLVVEKE